MESVFINATIITEFVLESGSVLARPTGPVPPSLEKQEKSTESTQLSGIKLGAQNREVAEVEDICDQCQGEAHMFCKQCNNRVFCFWVYVKRA